MKATSIILRGSSTRRTCCKCRTAKRTSASWIRSCGATCISCRRASGANSQLYQPFFDFGNIVEVTNEGIGNYNSLQAKIDKRFSHGLSFLGGYSWTHSLDDAVQPIQGTDGGQAGNPAFLGLKFEYGASATDVRHRFTFAPQYELPFGRGKQFLNHGGLVDGLAGGWKVAAVFQVQTGTPIALP